MARCPRAETQARPGMPHWAPKCLQQEPIQSPFVCPGEGVHSAKVWPRGSWEHPAADEDHQELPQGSRSELASPQPDTTTRPSCKWGLLQPGGLHPWGSQQEGTEGLGKPELGRGALEKGTRDPILLWAGGGQETEPCYAWESRIFIQGEGVTKQG